MYVIKPDYDISYSSGHIVFLETSNVGNFEMLSMKNSYDLCRFFQKYSDSEVPNNIIKKYLDKYFYYKECKKDKIFTIDYDRLLRSIKKNNNSNEFDFRLDCPYKIIWIPTLKCNNNCVYCGIPKINEKEEEIQCDFEIIYKRLEEAFKLGTRVLSIHGGEPLKYYDINRIAEIIKLCQIHDVKVEISTKSEISEKEILVLKNAGLKKIQLSVDTLEEKKAKYMYSENCLENFKKNMKNFSSRGFEVNVNIVLSTLNYDEVDSIKNIIKDNYDCNVFISNCRHSPYNSKKFSVKSENIDYDENNICDAGRFSLLILPSGKCALCDFLIGYEKYEFGDISKNKIIEIWLNLDKTKIYNFGENICHVEKVLEGFN